MHRVIADTAGGAWTFGGSILTSTFPMIVFIAVAGAPAAQEQPEGGA